MKTAQDLAGRIIDLVVSGKREGGGASVGEVFLDGLKELMARSDRQGRKALRDLSRLLYNESVNLNYDIATNGEAALMAAVCREGDTVFDVGANKGDWTRAVLAACPKAVVHCFELIPKTARQLAESMSGQGSVTVNPCGLGDGEGMIEANYCGRRSELSGLYDVHAGFATERVKCKLTTGQRYCERARIDRIRLLKVDCEGAEYAVLKGFGAMIRNKRIDVIQFEYGKANIAARVLLQDMHRLLEPAGYVLGRLYPDGVDFRPYALEDEDFTGPNHVACLKRDNALVSRLSGF